MDAETSKSSTGDNAPAQPAQSQNVQIPTVEAEGLNATYANFVRVSPSPEELVLDFGLNANLPGGGPVVAIKISDRIVLNYFTAKRLWGGLGLALQRHEQTFGVLETDVNKRVLPPSQRPQR